eukprot:GHRR01022844.1.p1 GENE.GHRR01022844.1~~GHRR01022844.1.p1  ORF type:complete len:135 (+),score=10.04 GHRR01022844.1:9-413(+)
MGCNSVSNTSLNMPSTVKIWLKHEVPAMTGKLTAAVCYVCKDRHFMLQPYLIGTMGCQLYKMPYLAEQEVGVDAVLSQVGSTRGAVGSILKMGANTLVAKRVATWCGKSVLDGLHTYGACEVLWPKGHSGCISS